MNDTTLQAAVGRLLNEIHPLDGNDAIVALTHAICEVASRHFSKSQPEAIVTVLREQMDDLMPEYCRIARAASDVR